MRDTALEINSQVRHRLSGMGVEIGNAVRAIGEGAFVSRVRVVIIKDGQIKQHFRNLLVGDRVLSTALHNYRYPKPLTQEQIQQKDEDAAKLALGRLSPS